MMERATKRVNVGVLVGRALTYHPQELVQGICQAAKDYDVNVIYILGTQRTKGDDVLKEFGVAENFDYQINTVYDYSSIVGVDVLIVSYGTIGVHLAVNDKEMFLKKFSNIPYIVLEDEADGSYIISDNYQGMQKIIQHLAEVHGYKKIALIAGPKGNFDAEQREQAYLETMREYGLEVPEGYICYGDFSAESGVIVEELLNNFPDLEAVACANDEMALGAYETCRRLGVRIGEELAITGCDNCSLADDMDPPLTTVNQNGFDMGYRALKEAIKLVNGSERIVMKVPASFCKRESCGCLVQKKLQPAVFKNSQSILAQVEVKATDIANRIVKNRDNREQLTVATRKVDELLRFMYDLYSDDSIMIGAEKYRKHLVYLLRRIIGGEYGKSITASILLKELRVVFEAFWTHEVQPEKQCRILMISNFVEEYVYSCMYRYKEREYNCYRTHSSMNSFFERKLMENINDEQQLFYNCVKSLEYMGIRGAMVCVTKEPILCKQGDEWVRPKEIYLAAMFNHEKVVTYEEKERPIIDEKHVLSSYFGQEDLQNYMMFPLFSGENHYGILLCDGEPEDIGSAYAYSLTLGNVLRLVQMSKAEKLVQKKLQGSMRLLQEKNKVLSFISAYDELTGMLNRRGFGEKAFEFTKKNLGRRGYFVFGDLDHLKEINDQYGHSEGDYAIIQCARVLNSNCGKNDLVGRIGGDEFVMMVASDDEDFETKIRENIKNAFAELNMGSGKPFYVEASIGVKAFVCEEEFDFGGILQQADKVMYESKKKRRGSVLREENR